MSDKDQSSAQSYLDKASSMAQSALGSITGNQADKDAAQKKQAESDARDQVSHAGTSIGGVSVSGAGVAKNDPDRQAGSWNQTVGSGKEALGGLIGSEGLKQAGADQNKQGKSQEASGQLNDLGSGVADRATGAIGGAVAGLTGNQAAKQDYEKQHDQGKTLQRGVESELDKKSEAAEREHK